MGLAREGMAAARILPLSTLRAIVARKGVDLMYEKEMEAARMQGEIARAKKKANDAEALSVILVFIIIYLLVF